MWLNIEIRNCQILHGNQISIALVIIGVSSAWNIQEQKFELYLDFDRFSFSSWVISNLNSVVVYVVNRSVMKQKSRGFSIDQGTVYFCKSIF